MLSAKDKPLLPGRDQATELKSSTTTQITNPSLVATTKPPVAGKPAVRLNVPMGSPTDKMMSPCTKQLQSKKFFKAEKSLRPKLLADSFRNAIEKQQQQLQQKQQQQSETSFD